MQDVPEAPGVGHVEGTCVQVARLPLGQHENRFDLVEFSAGVVPEIDRDETCHIAAVAVYIGFLHPELQGIGHVFPQTGLPVVEIDHVVPIVPGSGLKVPVNIAGIPFRMLFNQRIVPGRMVGHPIDDHIHPRTVDFLHQLFEILQGTELRVHGEIIPDAVVTTQTSFAVFNADGVDRHKPQYIDAHRFQSRKMVLKSGKSTFRGELPDVDLVYSGVF